MGNRTRERQRFTRAGLEQLDRRGVEEVAIERGNLGGNSLQRLGNAQLSRRAVERIAHDWMPETRHVHANLVGAPGLDTNLDERKFAVGRLDLLDDLVVAQGVASA